MKLVKNENRHSIKSMSQRFNIPESTLIYNCGIMGYRPERIDGKFQYALDDKQMEAVTNYKERRFEKSNVPEVIYVTRTIEIYESRMNYLNDNQL